MRASAFFLAVLAGSPLGAAAGEFPVATVGILIGRWLLGAAFTATSMIGFIAIYVLLRDDGVPLA